MNIGIFTETYYPQINGVVTSIRALEKELNKQGHKVYIFATTHPEAKQTARVFRLPSMPFWSMPSHRVAFSFSPQAMKLIKSLDLDIIHTQTEFPLGMLGKTAATMFNIPIVHTYHTMYEDYVHYILRGYVITPKMAQEFSKFFCNAAEAVVAPSPKVYNALRNYGVTRDIEIIPTGIQLKPFKKSNFTKKGISDQRIKYGFTDNTPLILSLGRVAKEKSIDVVIKAMPELLKKLPDAKLLIVGDGPVRPALEELTSNLKLNNSVIFAGQQPWSDVPKFYQMADVFVTASTSETQGLTYAEAMAGEIPVVAKRDENIEGLLINNINGRVFSDDEKLSEVLYDALKNKEKSKEMAAKAYIDVQPYSSEEFGRKMEELYSKVIEIHNTKKEKSHISNIKELHMSNIVNQIPSLSLSKEVKKIKEVTIKHTFKIKK